MSSRSRIFSPGRNGNFPFHTFARLAKPSRDIALERTTSASDATVAMSASNGNWRHNAIFNQRPNPSVFRAIISTSIPLFSTSQVNDMYRCTRQLRHTHTYRVMPNETEPALQLQSTTTQLIERGECMCLCVFFFCVLICLNSNRVIFSPLLSPIKLNTDAR